MTTGPAHVYRFAALRGTQAGRTYYVTMCPLGIIPKIFTFNESDVPPELRAQRVLQTGRVPVIARYITENRDSYAFSSITASVDGHLQFHPVSPSQPDIGHLVIDLGARFVINDGQHRRAAIEEALADAPELRTETISVVLFPDGDLRRSQQLFADLNKHGVRPTTSLGVLYDHRDGLSGLARALTREVPVFVGRVELERSNISYTSRALFTLSAIHQATARLLGKRGRAKVTESEHAFAVQFWTAVGDNMPGWQDVRARRQHAGELRRDQIQTHGLVLQALARVGRSLVDAHPTDWSRRMAPLQEIDWHRHNPDWEGRALLAGKLSKARANVILTANLIKQRLGLPLTSEELELESRNAPKS